MLSSSQLPPGHEAASALQATPSSASRRGPGRGNYPRKPKDQSNEAVHNHPPIYPALAPGTSSAYSYPSLATPNGTAHSPQARATSTPGAEGQSGYFNQNAGMEPPGSGQGESQRRKIRSHVTVEQQRRQRVDILLYERTKQEQSERRKERRNKGVIMDAWIKCLTLPPDWDSDDDAMHRMGGLDDLNKTSRRVPFFGDDPTADAGTSFGDVGDRAKSIAQAARRVARNLDGAAMTRPPRVGTSRRGIYSGAAAAAAGAGDADSVRVKDSGTPLASAPVPVIHTARMAIDDPRRKRPYKPRAKRNADMQTQTSRLESTSSGAKRKRGGGIGKGSSRGGRSGRVGSAMRPGESVQPLHDFLGPGTPGGEGAEGSEMGGDGEDMDDSVMGGDGDDDGDVDMIRGEGKDGDDDDETEDLDSDRSDEDDEGDESEDDDVSMDADEPADMRG